MPNERTPRFQAIDPAAWPRQPYFDHYFNAVRCTYSVAADIDVSALLERCKATGAKFYPAMIYCIATAVNRLPEMRVCFDRGGTLGMWDFMSPCYAVFHQENKTFSNIWTPYRDDFHSFHGQFLADAVEYGNDPSFFPKPDIPENCFTVSSLPWIDFTGFNINVFGDGRYLQPIFTLGQYSRENGRARVPLAVQVQHAACDGYHVGQLFESVRMLSRESPSWLA
jgi:Chloramphenicol O-acetyltransferase